MKNGPRGKRSWRICSWLTSCAWSALGPMSLLTVGFDILGMSPLTIVWAALGLLEYINAAKCVRSPKAALAEADLVGADLLARGSEGAIRALALCYAGALGGLGTIRLAYAPSGRPRPVVADAARARAERVLVGARDHPRDGAPRLRAQRARAGREPLGRAPTSSARSAAASTRRTTCCSSASPASSACSSATRRARARRSRAAASSSCSWGGGAATASRSLRARGKSRGPPATARRPAPRRGGARRARRRGARARRNRRPRARATTAARARPARRTRAPAAGAVVVEPLRAGLARV